MLALLSLCLIISLVSVDPKTVCCPVASNFAVIIIYVRELLYVSVNDEIRLIIKLASKLLCSDPLQEP